MLKHILLWKFTEEIKEEKAKETYDLLKNRFEKLPGKIEGLQNLELGFDVSGSGYDLALYAEFDDRKALAFYQQHPLHEEIKELAKDWVCGRAVVDYEV